MAVLPDSISDIIFGYMADYRVRDFDWPRLTLSWLPYNFNMGELSDDQSRCGSPTCSRKADGEPNNDRVVPPSPVLFVPGDLTPSPTIQAYVRWWLSEHHSSDTRTPQGCKRFLKLAISNLIHPMLKA